MMTSIAHVGRHIAPNMIRRRSRYRLNGLPEALRIRLSRNVIHWVSFRAPFVCSSCLAFSPDTRLLSPSTREPASIFCGTSRSPQKWETFPGIEAYSMKRVRCLTASCD
ncbi:unnamed protein product [Pylaiella littoralis]